MFLCVDVGSTFTKAALVGADGTLLGRVEVATTLPPSGGRDVMAGVDACRDLLTGADPGAADAELLLCSSAGGGLRIAVVGNEALVTAEAGRRVALSSGGRVVHVAAGSVEAASLRAARPDVVLLVGGTDGGNEAVLLRCAEQLAGCWAGPVVVAGNVHAQDRVARLLDAAGATYVITANVVPRIGLLAPEPARRAVRRMFLDHVIGGKHLSGRPEFTTAVRGATPDVVLTAVELLAEAVGDVVVVDVGGATTDVYSAVGRAAACAGEDQGDDAGAPGADVVGQAPVNRTVEGDLGVRWSAVPTVEEAVRAGLLADDPRIRAAAEERQREPAYLPADAAAAEDDLRLAAAAAGVAVRRHAGRAEVRWTPEGGVVERGGADLTDVALVVASGGVLRHAPGAARRVAELLAPAAGWQLPRAARVVVDTGYVLAPAGLLAADHPEVARRLLDRHLRLPDR